MLWLLFLLGVILACTLALGGLSLNHLLAARGLADRLACASPSCGRFHSSGKSPTAGAIPE